MTYRRRVGAARPSHLMFTGGVGGLVELPNFTVIVQGLEEWSYTRITSGTPTINEPRLLAAVRTELGPQVTEMRPAPWLEGESADPNGPANQVGVPVVPFPAWFRCTSCNLLGSLESGTFGFTNDYASRPFEAQFSHQNCRGRSRYAVPARFLLACRQGHLDEFPYAWFVHQGQPCAGGPYPALRMEDLGAEAAANVRVSCLSCDVTARNMRRVQGRRGREELPRCRGRHPHLGTYADCDEPAELLILGASNQWFGVTRQTLALPPDEGDELAAVIETLWDRLSQVTSFEVLGYAYAQQFHEQLSRWSVEEVWAAVEARRAAPAEPSPVQAVDLLRPEWELFTRPDPPRSDDFTVRAVAVPTIGRGRLAEVKQVERLRLARALLGFTRLDAPDPEEQDAAVRAELSRAQLPGGAGPRWVPATENRGEGLFVRLDPDALAAWEARTHDHAAVGQHRVAYARYRQNRHSSRGRPTPGFDWTLGWPGLRYYLVHSMSHIVLRAIALECGYAAASLAERIYARLDDDMAGFLIYTAVPDAEGTLGGLVSLGEPDRFQSVLTRALRDANGCSSDPLCAERRPTGTADTCYAASCHVCMFLSETSCERGNRFLDRRLVVNLGEPALAFWDRVDNEETR